MFIFLANPAVAAACGAFAAVVLVPIARKLAARTKTPLDDAAVSFVERMLARFKK